MGKTESTNILLFCESICQNDSSAVLNISILNSIDPNLTIAAHALFTQSSYSCSENLV